MQVEVKSRLRLTFTDGSGATCQGESGVATIGEYLVRRALEGCTNFRINVTTKIVPPGQENDPQYSLAEVSGAQ